MIVVPFGGQICELIPNKELQTSMTSGRVIAVAFSMLGREVCQQSFAR